MHYSIIAKVNKMFIKKPKHRIFDYSPRFYNPENDPVEKRKKKLGFKRELKSIRKKRSPVIWILFIVVVIYIYLKLSGFV
jgi:hypothetical protein